MRNAYVNRALLVCSIFMLSGCAALLIGGAAAGGYAVGKDERPPGTMLDDGTITASVKARLAADKYIRALAIDVDTYQGVVTLHGNVVSYVERDHAAKLASDVKGVSSVVNKIEVKPPK